MKYTLLLCAIFCGSIIAYYAISDELSNDTMKYISYYDKDKKHIRSETSYIPDSNSIFYVCSTISEIPPCRHVNGIKQGLEKWYENGYLKYESKYEHGNLKSLVEYYPNGLKRREKIYANGDLQKELFYDKGQMNQILKTIVHKGNDTFIKYYANGKVIREEKYQNKMLVSRKKYDSEGRLYQLEEYGSFSTPFDLFDEFHSGSRARHNQPKEQNNRKTPESSNDMWI